ncbi:NACHT, LRR and PYD domains-containing protein 12 [Pimephales promelas]|uniref:NACHT, LRR and PYD domains-containing protein 12 n=1 Tax=Pimephales promelas TaxID=90988 RepID=UPI001955C3AB|nr:NACHT, LRR and PYD domains-containing protein 12 [Pimephales promelas]KAG1929693.1 NACHT, LRR and PYD domains-containing protein 3-like [Pimephales promelas]
MLTHTERERSAAMERVNTSSFRGFLRSCEYFNEKIRYSLQKKLNKLLSSRRRTTGSLEDTVKKLKKKYGKKNAFKRIKSIVKKMKEKKHITNGDSVQTDHGNMPLHQPNNLQQQQHNNNNNSTSLRQPSIQNLDQHNLTIRQENGGLIVAPNIVGNNAQDVNINVSMEPPSTSVNKNEILQNVRNKMKSRMLPDAERTFEGSIPQAVSLNRIYTELFIIDDESDPINREHEIWQMETTQDSNASAQRHINYNDIFKPRINENVSMKTVLTKGIAGIGKTITVQKFVLDWANGEANQNLDLVFLLPFRNLNLLEGEKSLFDLLCDFYPEFKEARPISEWICDREVLLILDGLDEYKKDLNFQSRLLSDVTTEATVDVLLVNLLRGNLLSSARLWITSRPVAAGQLDKKIFLRGYITQIRGFRDEQKEEYFKRHLEDPQLTQDIICHLKSQKSLWILCHIPLFCWISVVVLRDIITRQNKHRNMPSNLTEMYIHYLLIQTGLSHEKYQGAELSQQDALKQHKDLIMKLAELAHRQLMEQNVIFREEDLKTCNITVDEAHQYPGVITCVTENKCGYMRTKLFTFIHLSVQEFFAALFKFHTFLSGNQDSKTAKKRKILRKTRFCDILIDEINEALRSKNGHLDLFICFLFGISCDSSRDLLEGLLPPSWVSLSDDHKKVTTYIKSLKRKGLSSERCISLVRCLVELKDKSFLQEMRDLERSRSKEPLTQFQCSLLAYQFVMSDMNHDEFDLRKYNITLEGFQRFSPAITCFRKALLKGSGFTEQHCDVLTRYLRSPNSHLIHLDLSHNDLGRSALNHLSTALCDPNCQIQTLNLSHNDLQSQDMELIRDVLLGENMNLRLLELSDNPLGDSGVKILSSGLKGTKCHLEVLKLSGCQIQGGVHQLMSSLKANSSSLKELDLRYNNLGNIVQETLKDESLCSVRTSTGVCSLLPGLYKYAVTLTFDPQTANEHLHLNKNNTVATHQKQKQQFPDNAERFDLCNQVLCRPALSERSFFAVDVIGPDLHVGVACGGIERKGASDRVCLGRNEMSWSLYCSDRVCEAHHNQKTVSVQAESFRKLGVFLDREARSVCFYSLSPRMKLLYMFDADFPEGHDLFAAFRIQEPGCLVNLRQESL